MTNKRKPEHDLKNIEKLGRKNFGCRYERTEFNNREKAFADHWRELNNKKTQRSINHGFGILQDLLIEGDDMFINIQKPKYAIVLITPIHRYIVATIIQWLGSNVGWCFLEVCLKRCGYQITRIKNETTKCENCGGSGKIKDGKYSEDCSICYGTGQVEINQEG